MDDLGRLIKAPVKERNIHRQVPAGRELCREILKAQPGLDIYEIIEEMRKRGYVFSTRDPVNSVRPMLYRAREFARKNGRFSLKTGQ